MLSTFYGAVPFYDSRRRIENRLRLEFVPGERVHLVLLGQNSGSLWVKFSWAVAGLFAAFAIVWIGCRIFGLTGRKGAGKAV
jgi:hypothetical protein